MSYILDALRKADAQRERDPARGIHAQPVAVSPLGPSDSQQTRRWLWGAAAVTGAGLLGAAAWWLAQPAAPLRAAAVTSPPAYVPPASVEAAPAPVAALPPPATEVLPPAPPAPPLPASPPAPPKPAAVLAPSVSLPATAAADRLISVTELPADVQRELPKLSITGGVYSANPAQRLLIVNGQVLGEGVEAAPGVLLVQIRPKTAVLIFRGYRYGVAY